MINYLEQLEKFLENKIIELDTITLRDDTTPFGVDFKPDETAPPPKEGDSIDLVESKVIGDFTPSRTIKVSAKTINDLRSKEGVDKSVYVWNTSKKCLIRRKI